MEQSITDYLTKQVQIDRNVVTFRSLSRYFNTHVNTAKNNLAAFHAASRSSQEPVYATYMLTGEVTPPTARSAHSQEDGMDVDAGDTTTSGEMREHEREQDSDVVPLMKVLLVGENDLEKAKTQYLRVFSQVVYSLSPAHLIDSSLICPPTEKVYEVDAKVKADTPALLGRLIGPHVHVGKPVVLTPLPAKTPVVPLASTVSKQAAATKSEQQDSKPKPKPQESKPSLKPKESKISLKPRASGTLDWGKAKSKQQDEGTATKGKEKEKAKEKEADEVKEKEKSKVKPEDTKKVASPVAQSKAKKASPVGDVKGGKMEEKRGVKRKSVLPSSSDDEEAQDNTPRKKSPLTSSLKQKEKDEKPSTSKSSTTKPSLTGRKSTRALMSDSDDDDSHSSVTPPPAKGAAKNKNGVKAKKAVLSDSDEEDTVERGKRRKTKVKDKTRSSIPDKSLQAMMDIDDDDVIKASRSVAEVDTEVETEEEAPPDTQTEDFIEDSEPERVKQRPRKRKQDKKPVPVGSNGLKKRRVMRTRTKTDVKGYMVTEDYSSYESVDEEEVEEPVKGRGKGKKGASTSTKSKKNADEDSKDVTEAKDASKEKKSGKAAEKPAKSRKSVGKAGQGSLMNFFGKPK
ncbi:DNA polymerase subunit Cdc27-domain-containing protein [Rhodofomes roseus]|uniref:DNA polymerase delta subunit 3 n=1 Tax=Rhodofomes roseus TaxID=34475 RepID=A0ABQ8KZI0_9APHY|nr:DNA polymerase subunit Cdc27-domain-containing protein [Rhodofomes roseus]KAH9843862.1 DNA polymerase subunit Cdc27-domain-containing protein [Rhodofomes roseus]